MRRPLPCIPPRQDDELLSSWLTRTSEYYRTTTRSLLEQIGCVETSPEALDRSAGPADMVALASALRVGSTDLLQRMSFNGVPAPVLAFVSPWAKLRECRRCRLEFRSRGMATAVLRQWCIAFATTCRRCGHLLRPCPWRSRRDEEDAAAEWITQRAARLCAALEPALHEADMAAVLSRVMAALATPLPVAVRGCLRRLDRPLLHRSLFYRREARSKTTAADPDRPFACWSVPAQLAAICLLGDLTRDDRAWSELAERDLVGHDDRDVVRSLLARRGFPAGPQRRAQYIQ